LSLPFFYNEAGTRFPGGRPSISSFNFRTTEKTTTTSTGGAVKDLRVSSEDDNESVNPGSASISIPVYRPPIIFSREIIKPKEPTKVTEESGVNIPSNLLNLDDIYKKSEMKQHSEAMTFKPSSTEEPSSSEDSSTTPVVSTANTEHSLLLTTMSTEKSSSFSISVDERMVEADNIELEANKARKVPSNVDGQKVEIKDFEQTILPSRISKPVQIVTSSPVASLNELKPQSKIAPDTTTTTTSSSTPSSSSGNTSTKIVKTVRVRQRMRGGSGSSSSGFHGAIRNRFNGASGGGRIRVVHRPVTPDYVKVFPELSSSHTDKLAKDEEEEVKKALIELKRSEPTHKSSTHGIQSF